MGKKDLIIGLDVGSDSVGWAVTDENFNLWRIKGKTAWGARIFDEASDAKTRRTKRSSRRRQARRKYRIYLLNQLFTPLINEKDPSFFVRLENSTLLNEDKAEAAKDKWPLFINEEDEKTFYKNYPTIWHLRKELMSNPDSEAFNDVRNVYLAIHHIIKYRGNFLTNGTIETKKFEPSFVDDVNQYFRNLLNSKNEDEVETDYCFLSPSKIKDFTNALENTKYNVRDRKSEILKLVDKGVEELKPYIELFVSLVSGGEFDLKKIPEIEDSCKVKFDNSFDEKADEVASLLNEDYALVFYAKRIFDFFKLKDLLRNEESISAAFCDVYESHKEQLKFLKELCKDLDKKHELEREDSLFFKLFKDKNCKENYPAFVRVDSNEANTDPHIFNSYVVKLFSPYEDELKDNPGFKKIKELCERDECLLTIANCSTSLIPHQLHENELVAILENASKHYPEISEIKEKVIKLFEYRVPYYFGPLNDRSNFSNVVRKNNSTITPWSIDEVIDKEKTREKFMEGHTNSCTYLLGEPVLPAQSIVYQQFVILNRLNTMRINGALIEQAVKEKLLAFILARKKTTIHQLKVFLKKQYDDYKKDDVSISGINEEDPFVSDSYSFFLDFFNEKEALNDKEVEEAEKIIYALAIYTDNPSDAVEYLEKVELFKFNEQQRKALASKRITGWGRLSKKLLVGLRPADDNGVASSIMETLRENIVSFEALVASDEFKFGKAIKEHNRMFAGEKTQDEVVDTILETVPPKMRRSTIQAIRIVDEIVKLSGQKPKYISVEVTRGEDEKKKGKTTTSREKEVADFINSLLKDSDNYLKSQASHIKEEYEKLQRDDNLLKLNSRHLYLYFKQDGIDLYTGKPIDINDVLNSDKYDLDHIVPQHLMKDDSLDNMVLVERTYNQNIKKGYYPIPEQIRCNKDIRALWDLLHRKKAISDKKYNNLIRAKEITEEELNGFVNAQINVVNHSNIVIRDILKVKYPNTRLIFSKARFPSFLRKEYGIPKMRELNDTHHAVDAYLNAVTGVTLTKEYALDYAKHRSLDKTYNMEKRLLDVLGENKKDERIQKICGRTDFLLTYRQQFIDSSFHGETIYKHGDGDLVSIHSNGAMLNTSKYGGYSNLTVSYWVVATVSGKKVRKVLVDVPVLWDKLYSQKEDLYHALCSSIEIKDNEKVTIDLSRKILPNQKVFINGATYLLCNFNKNVVTLKPETPIYLESDDIMYLNGAIKRRSEFKECIGDVFERVSNRKGDEFFSVSKEKNKKILDKLVAISAKNRYDYCPMIRDVRNFSNGLEGKSLYEQIGFLKSTILLFTRKSTLSEQKRYFSKSKQSFLNDKVEVIYDSITGLKSYKKEL